VRSILFSRTALLASTIALLGSLGCSKEEPKVQAADYPGEMAGGYCNAVFSCQCEDYPYASPNECFAELLEDYDTVNDEAFLSGLLYDGTCPAQELSEIESLACRGAVPAVPEGICVPPCNVWHGNQQVGFPCQVLASSPELGLAWSNCGQGLTCNGEVCVNPCAGGVMLPAIGQPCPEGVCAAGAICDATMTCVAAPALPSAGQPCLDGVCNASSVCVTATNTCAALPTIGNLCIEGQCDANSICEGQICVARPPLACFLLGGGGVPGDGDGDPTTGDGDGDPTTGDGDGDPTTGDGDGDGDCGSTTFLPETVPAAWAGNTAGGPIVDAGSCGGGNGPEQMLTYVAPQSGIYQMSTEGSLIDTVLYVRDGDCLGAELACNDDDVDLAPASILTVSLTAGQQVTIFVDSFEADGGEYVLAITLI
jgi:hypothetical protein